MDVVIPEARAHGYDGTDAANYGPNSARWKKVEQLLDHVLDQREASEREGEAKVVRLRARNSARHGVSTPADANTPMPRKPRRGE